MFEPDTLVNERFGRLRVERFAGYSAGEREWIARCDCGRYSIVTEHRLLTGKTKSCGCRRADLAEGILRRMHDDWDRMERRLARLGYPSR